MKDDSDSESVAERLLPFDVDDVDAGTKLPQYKINGYTRRDGGPPPSPLLIRLIKPLAFVVLCCLFLAFSFWLGWTRAEATKQPVTSTSSTNAAYNATRTDHAAANDQLVHDSHARNRIVFSNGTTFDRPPTLKVVGLVFYGRPQFVDILDCYLRRNLVVNGGILDKIQFAIHTGDEADQQWLQDLVSRDGLEEQYELQFEEQYGDGFKQWGKAYSRIWKTLTDPDTIYVKIDDDIVFIDDSTIPEMVRTVLEHPEAHSVMGNVINNQWTYWYHHKIGAIYPYAADRSGPAPRESTSWRVSELPAYSGALPATDEDWTNQYKPPFERHRWLPVKSENMAESLAHTPYGEKNIPVPGVWRPGKDDGAGWAIGAQSHYSFFQNVERGLLNKYHFGNPIDGTFNNWYSHYSINMMAIRGSHVALKPFWDDLLPEAGKSADEAILTEIVPELLHMPVLIATRAIVSHFSYRFDRKDMLKTDILDRYRLYANEMVCAADNQKNSF